MREVASSGGRHTCATCAVSYTNRQNLERHVREKHAGQSHVCEWCGATFPRRYRLEAHVAKHVANDGEDRFRCTLCPATSSTRAGLTRHVRCHASDDGGGTPCPDCGVMFKHYWLMKLHRRHHASARLTCSVCGRLFRYRSHMLEHMRSHAATFPDGTVAHKTKRAVLAVLGQKAAHSGNVCLTSDDKTQRPQQNGKVRTCQDIDLRVPGGNVDSRLCRYPAVDMVAAPERLPSDSDVGRDCGGEHDVASGVPPLATPASRNMYSERKTEDTTAITIGEVDLAHPSAAVDSSHSAVACKTTPTNATHINTSDFGDHPDSSTENLRSNVHGESLFSDERRPLTLQDAVRELTSDSQSDPSMQIEFVSDFPLGQDLLTGEPEGSDFTSSSAPNPAQYLHSNLSGGEELGFELDVDAVNGGPLAAASLHPGDGLETEELQLELDIGGDAAVKGLGLVSSVGDDARFGADLAAGSMMPDLGRSVLVQDLEGELGAGLAEWLGQGVRVEVEESRGFGETVMVITLVDE